MHRRRLFPTFGIMLCLLAAFATSMPAQSKPTRNGDAPAADRHFAKAFVIDERLSALREAPDLHAMVVKRLRIGRAVYITSATRGRPAFYRVAVTRRTRGWIHQGALMLPGRVGEDERVIEVIEQTNDGLDRLALCRLFLERFGHSRHAPRALLLVAEEAERAAASLTQHARRRLKTLGDEGAGAEVEDYYLSDPGLDRYSRLHIAFRFDAAQTRYAYDGKAYRELLRRYPQSAEAATARRRLENLEPRLAKEK
jgi:hypothetical protein